MPARGQRYNPRVHRNCRNCGCQIRHVTPEGQGAKRNRPRSLRCAAALARRSARSSRPIFVRTRRAAHKQSMPPVFRLVPIRRHDVLRRAITPRDKVNPTRSIHAPITSTAPTPIHSFTRNDLQVRQCHRPGGAREALRPPVPSLQSKGRFAAPPAPHDEEPGPVPRLPPTLRGLDARQRHVPLHRQSMAPCSPIPPASGFRARHHDERLAAPDGSRSAAPAPRCHDGRIARKTGGRICCVRPAAAGRGTSAVEQTTQGRGEGRGGISGHGGLRIRAMPGCRRPAARLAAPSR